MLNPALKWAIFLFLEIFRSKMNWLDFQVIWDIFDRPFHDS